MSDDKNKVADKASEIARNIWLAGVGAYGRAVDEAQGRFERAGVEPPKLFRDLVRAGTALEEDARGALVASAAAKSTVEERINRVRENFHMQRPARIEDITVLHKKLDQLTRKVDQLTKALAAQGIIKKTTPRKSASTKKSPAGNTPAAAKKTGSRTKKG